MLWVAFGLLLAAIACGALCVLGHMANANGWRSRDDMRPDAADRLCVMAALLILMAMVAAFAALLRGP